MEDHRSVIPGFCHGLAVLMLALLVAATPAAAQEEDRGKTTMRHSVIDALEYSPRLQLLRDNQEAIGYERERAEGGYYPRLDLTLGYGEENHDDSFSRSIDEENDWEERTEAALRLTQLLYDGDETGSRVAVETAKLQSADYRVYDNGESIALDAVIAHLEVYRQQELVVLAEKNLKDHKDILGMLEERQKGGVGSIADVLQTRTRFARARSSVADARASLAQARANYLRVVGHVSEDLQFAPVPREAVPKSEEAALKQTRDANPSVLALTANIEESEELVNLSESSFHPKINLELSSSYEDQVESSQTYEHNNQAMIRLRWNLLNGTSDIADVRAQTARRNQAISAKNDQLITVMEETRSTWALYEAAKEQVVAYGDATTNSDKTVDSYLKQFKVGQRTLLDVLDARNELFQSSGLLVTARVNEQIAIYRLLALGGRLNSALGIEPHLYRSDVATGAMHAGAMN